MTGFSAEWLALREPADARARDAALSAQLARWAHERSAHRVLDLASGTGANVRYLAPRLGEQQRWLLVDSDAVLLEKARAVAHGEVETRCLDLAAELHALELAPDVIVTASALLDLVSDGWLAQLVAHCRAAGCAVLFALSYDGRMELTPREPDDEWIRMLVNRHQRSDKGFGPALGPSAWERAAVLLAAAGYDVKTARSDWKLLPDEQLLQRQLLEGWASAATELAPDETSRCRRWLARRLEHLANDASHLVVGHEDVLALLQTGTALV